MRYIAEPSGAVLDTCTGLREWFDSHRDAIDAATRKNREYRREDEELEYV